MSHFSAKLQLPLYLIFAVLMIGLNIAIQNLHLNFIVPWATDKFGNIPLVQKYYLKTDPYNLPELIGSVIAVGITYIIKFILDKFVVFRLKLAHSQKKSTIGKEFGIYLIFAIFTTLENIGFQFVLGILTELDVNIRIIIALLAGYLTKFYLDRKYVFKL